MSEKTPPNNNSRQPSWEDYSAYASDPNFWESDVGNTQLSSVESVSIASAAETDVTGVIETQNPPELPTDLSETEYMKEHLKKAPGAVVDVEQAWDEAHAAQKKMGKAVKHSRRAKERYEDYASRGINGDRFYKKTLKPVDALRAAVRIKRAERAKAKAGKRVERVSDLYKKIHTIDEPFKQYDGWENRPTPEDNRTAPTYEQGERTGFVGEVIDPARSRYKRYGEAAIGAAVRGGAGGMLKMMLDEWRMIKANEKAKKQAAKANRFEDRYRQSTSL